MPLGKFMCAMASLVLLASARPAPALEREGQSFAASAVAHEQPLELFNVALLRVGWVFKVYVAGLYLADPSDAERVLDDVPKRLDIAYLRALTKDVLIQAADEHLSKSLTPEQRSLLQERLDRINSWYVDVKPGDRYTLTYVPGVGSELELNGRSLGLVPGADFAAAYFAVWLGKDCARPEFRDALLTRPAG